MTFLSKALQDLKENLNLSESLSYYCLTEIFKGESSDADLKELLVRLADKGETVDEMVGFARAMREAMVAIELDAFPLLDVCGTGGSGKNRFNISTAVAFCLSAGGVNVAKHGNYGSAKPNGSFNFLEALKVPIHKDPVTIKAQLEMHHLTFLFAKNHHPAMRFVGPIRQQLARRTIFNILGPLCNPASATHQLLGTTSLDLGEKLAQALHRLGTEAAMICIGGDGSDELSLSGKSTVIEVRHTIKRPYQIVAQQYGLSEATTEGGTGEENAALFVKLLQNPGEQHPILDQIALNAGYGFLLAGVKQTPELGIAHAKELIQSGAVLKQVLSFTA